MKYVIDEEELLDLIDQYDYNEPNIKDFLKSKTPVEEIAEDYLHTSACFDKYKNKNIKIHIEVIK